MKGIKTMEQHNISLRGKKKKKGKLLAYGFAEAFLKLLSLTAQVKARKN